MSIATPSGADRYNTRIMTLVGTLSQPVTENWTAFLKLGMGRTHSTSEIRSIGYYSTSSKTPVVFGLGGRYALSPRMSIFVRYDHFGRTGRYANGDSITASMLGLGMRIFLD